MHKRIGTILIFLILLSSCTESVSDQLKANSSASPTSLTTSTTNTFRVVNGMGENFSHYLHDAEAISGDCKISGNDLEASGYDRTDTSIAKDCFLEVEELDLFYQGASLNVKADAGMCEYMVFKPFYFWQYQAGKTERTVYFIECDDTCSGNTQCGNYYYNSAGPTNHITNYNTPESFDDVQQFCHFDHTQKADLEDESPPNCDEGSVNVITVSFSEDSANPGSCATTAGVASDPEETDCGGEMTACLAGPAKELVSGFPDNTGMLIFNEDLSAIDETYEVAAPFDQGYKTNMYAANYMRSCYDTSANKSNNNVHDSATFLGHNIESFATITNTDGSLTTDDEGYFARPRIYEHESSVSNDKYELYSSNPFRGRYYSGKPYYGFYCLDRAFDIKAQIRIFIRDWDRSFSRTNLFLDNTSDVNQTDRYMDTQESADDTLGDTYDNGGLAYNNVYDWDDFLQSNYLYNWEATNSTPAHLEKFDFSTNDWGTPDSLSLQDETTNSLINNTCTDMSSPYYEYNFPRAGL